MVIQTDTHVARASDRELVVTRSFDAPVHTVFKAWTTPALFQRWWAPASMGVKMLSCEMDVRPGGSYRVVFGHEGTEGMAFFGRYLDVVPNVRLLWTNDEGADGAVTTVTFTEKNGRTQLVLRELYPTKEALDESGPGTEGSTPEQFAQLDALLAAEG